MTNDPILRKLTTADISGALALSTEAGWNQTADDWRMLIELSPQGCIAIEVEGEVVSTATLTCYGTRLAWIGMVLTRIKYRGRGFAMRLLKECLGLADELGIESVKLDATNLGQPLYEKLGFRAEQPVERWWRAGREDAMPPSVPPPSSNDWQSADQNAFGVDRSALLAKLARRNASARYRRFVPAHARGSRNFLSRSIGVQQSANRPEVDRARSAKPQPRRLVLGSAAREQAGSLAGRRLRLHSETTSAPHGAR